MNGGVPVLPDPYADRTYRTEHAAKDLIYFRVTAEQTDLHIGARMSLEREATAAVLRVRELINEQIASRPRFKTSLEPLDGHGGEPEPIRRMLRAGTLASVGPMAAVAGAVAEYTGRALSEFSPEIIVENGGDVFLMGERERVVAIYAGESPMSGILGVKVRPGDGLGVCTSSGTVGHSLSFGHADAALVVAKDCALADAAATRLGNLIKNDGDISGALDEIMSVKDVIGAVAIIGESFGAKGNLELIPLR